MMFPASLFRPRSCCQQEPRFDPALPQSCPLCKRTLAHVTDAQLGVRRVTEKDQPEYERFHCATHGYWHVYAEGVVLPAE